jgi:hypothetical protein
VNRVELTVGWRPGALCLSNLDNMKIKCSYERVQYLGDCSKCSEPNLAQIYGDQIINGEPVCVTCQINLTATERSEGARPSEAR